MWRLFLLSLLLLSAPACDRDSTKDAKPPPPVEERSTEEKTFGQNPLTLHPDTDTGPTTQLTVPASVTLTPPDAGPTILELPPARLLLSKDGTATLDASSDDRRRPSLHLEFRPTTDGQLPWKHANYRLELSTLDDDTTDGLYLPPSADAPQADPTQLRPVSLTLDLIRDTPGSARIRIQGQLVPAEADSLDAAPRHSISADFPATIQTAP